MSGKPRHDFAETSYSLRNTKVKHYNMEKHKGFGLAWTCGHGLHALDEHHCNILPHLIGWCPCQLTIFKPGDVGCGGVETFDAFPACFSVGRFFHLTRNSQILRIGLPTFLTRSTRIASTSLMSFVFRPMLGLVVAFCRSSFGSDDRASGYSHELLGGFSSMWVTQLCKK